jgi:hypothetical protein
MSGMGLIIKFAGRHIREFAFSVIGNRLREFPRVVNVLNASRLEWERCALEERGSRGEVRA